MIDTLFGLRIVSSPYATSRVCRVEKVAIKKRRRGYRVVARTEPAMYRLADGTVVAHPTIIQKLKEAAA